ncbi:hypothetical protein ACDX66_14425 [Peribacillus frigoritolerans]
MISCRLLVSFGHLLVNFAVLLVNFAVLLVNFAVLLVNFAVLLVNLCCIHDFARLRAVYSCFTREFGLLTRDIQHVFSSFYQKRS